MITSYQAGLRIGDAERQHAAAALATHLGAGRLTMDEYDQRVQAAYAARTEADLTGLFADLPSLSPPRREVNRLGHRPPREHHHHPRAILPLVLAVMIAFTVLTHIPPFPLIPLLVFVAVHRRRRWHAQWSDRRPATAPLR